MTNKNRFSVWLPLVFAILASPLFYGMDRRTATRNVLGSAIQDTAVSFARNVFPILERSCVQCHGGADENGEPIIEEGLNMLTYEGLMAGSLYGTVIEAGNPDESYLVELIAAGDMPKEGDALKPEEITLIRRWIAAGARNN